MPKKIDAYDLLACMEDLLARTLAPEGRLYKEMEAQLARGEEKPDVKPLKEVLGLLAQVRELRREERPAELTVRFSGKRARAWSE